MFCCFSFSFFPSFFLFLARLRNILRSFKIKFFFFYIKIFFFWPKNFFFSVCTPSHYVYRHSSMLHRWQSRLAGTGWSEKLNIRPLSSVQQSRSWLGFIYNIYKGLVKWAGWTQTKIKDHAKIDKVIHTYVLCHFLASDCVTSQNIVKLQSYSEQKLQIWPEIKKEIQMNL